MQELWLPTAAPLLRCLLWPGSARARRGPARMRRLAPGRSRAPGCPWGAPEGRRDSRQLRRSGGGGRRVGGRTSLSCSPHRPPRKYVCKTRCFFAVRRISRRFTFPDRGRPLFVLEVRSPLRLLRPVRGDGETSAARNPGPGFAERGPNPAEVCFFFAFPLL